MGTLIAIDGVDASGKQTQSKLLYEKLESTDPDTRLLSFPMYDNDSSVLVKMYLNGDFGKKPSDVNAYAASTFFAADRFATFRTNWGKDYNDGKIIVADRYVSSNMIHQAGKISDIAEKDKFLDWLDDLEYGIYSLPRPDLTIFLDMPVKFAMQLMANRNNKITGKEQRDIHESDERYLCESYENACYIAKKYNWISISCVLDGKIKSAGEINKEICSYVLPFLEKNK